MSAWRCVAGLVHVPAVPVPAHALVKAGGELCSTSCAAFILWACVDTPWDDGANDCTFATQNARDIATTKRIRRLILRSASPCLHVSSLLLSFCLFFLSAAISCLNGLNLIGFSRDPENGQVRSCKNTRTRFQREEARCAAQVQQSDIIRTSTGSQAFRSVEPTFHQREASGEP